MSAATTVVALGDEKNREWRRFKLVNEDKRGMRIGDVVRTRRGVQCVIESWGSTKVHVVCGEGKGHSFYPASLKLTIVEV